MAAENPTWGTPRIHGELRMLGFNVSERTVSRYLPRRPPPSDAIRRWLTFLRNHRDAIAAMDFFAVPTMTFRVIYVWFAVAYYHDDRTHLGLGKATPTARLVERRPDAEAEVVALPRVGGLHHRYKWCAAAQRAT